MSDSPQPAPPEPDLEQPKPAEAVEPAAGWSARSNAWTDLALTIPIFLGYHLGVITMPVRNAADMVTAWLVGLANNNLGLYVLVTVVIGLGLAGVLALLGRGQAFELWRLGLVVIEGAAYAVAMGAVALYVVGSLRLGSPAAGAGTLQAGIVMALGAGLYEEIAFRVGIYGVVSLLLKWLTFSPVRAFVLRCIWAVVAAGLFSLWHYVGPLSDAFELRSFVFRWVCGLSFTLIYVTRGFAPAVWTHALYDIWVLALG